MYLARSLVRNLKTTASQLLFGAFRMYRPRIWSDVRGYESTNPNGLEYLYERKYDTMPSQDADHGPPFDFEDTLLLLRLFRAGDIAFEPLTIEGSDGSFSWQQQYPVTHPLRSGNRFCFEPADCGAWDRFAEDMKLLRSWHSTWFKTARRFFLQGSTKKFNPEFDEADRLVDFAIALEAVLVPERDFSSRRLRERAAALDAERTQPEVRKQVAKMLYDFRSTIVHGSSFSDAQKSQLQSRTAEIEDVVRDVIVSALRHLPADDSDRLEACSRLWDISLEARAEYVSEMFRGLPDEARQIFARRCAGAERL